MRRSFLYIGFLSFLVSSGTSFAAEFTIYAAVTTNNQQPPGGEVFKATVKEGVFYQQPMPHWEYIAFPDEFYDLNIPGYLYQPLVHYDTAQAGAQWIHYYKLVVDDIDAGNYYFYTYYNDPTTDPPGWRLVHFGERTAS